MIAPGKNKALHGLYRDTLLMEKLGPSFVEDAFRAAHAADPAAELIYNDYNVIDGDDKADRMYEMVRGLLRKGVPVHVVGFQTHVKGSEVENRGDMARARSASAGQPSRHALTTGPLRAPAGGLGAQGEEQLEPLRRARPQAHPLGDRHACARLARGKQSNTAAHRLPRAARRRAVAPGDGGDHLLGLHRQVLLDPLPVPPLCRRQTPARSKTLSDAMPPSRFGADEPLLLDDEYGLKPAYMGCSDGALDALLAVRCFDGCAQQLWHGRQETCSDPRCQGCAACSPPSAPSTPPPPTPPPSTSPRWVVTYIGCFVNEGARTCP